ncbi:AraC family transcriptional regulator [Oceanidesulfovibrio indonesiensis]|uniref:AraC family transcriptional regulator n=1 Tax=Oceanidesulfovibrio indonesiensis TaxID=54767 RepID=A0A7M3MA47_9BACT|nr:AraC family transcriptional regulator [Oceanidesulfovibrio indonesiensis]TVM14352.1 AraC family transcriptional regulator [Oceanidesulfovibrio indonesiensis]
MTNTAAEKVHVHAPSGFPGVELMRARYVTQRFSRHFHEEYAIGVIERGAMRFRYLGNDMTAAAGQVNIVVPGEPHDGHAAADHGWTYRMFYLAPAVLEAALQEVAPQAHQVHFAVGVIADSELAARVLRAHCCFADPGASTLARQTLLLDMLTHWISRHGDRRSSLPATHSEAGAADAAREIISERHAEDLRLEEIATYAGMSPFHLVRVFKARFGLTPHAFLVHVRIHRARALLRTHMRLADIAAAVGFSDQSHLTRHFRRQYGVTPGAYRNFIQNSARPHA